MCPKKVATAFLNLGLGLVMVAFVLWGVSLESSYHTKAVLRTWCFVVLFIGGGCVGLYFQ